RARLPEVQGWPRLQPGALAARALWLPRRVARHRRGAARSVSVPAALRLRRLRGEKAGGRRGVRGGGCALLGLLSAERGRAAAGLAPALAERCARRTCHPTAVIPGPSDSEEPAIHNPGRRVWMPGST